MRLAQVVDNIVEDTAVELTQEFDRNFERKAFFDQQWKQTRFANSNGSLMMRTGALRRSVNKRVNGDSISWSSNLPYASLHNEGGEIEVTAKMKSFFWAMFYKANGAAKSGGPKKRAANLSAEALKWKAMALMPVGKIMSIEQRQFIGWHPLVDKSIEGVIEDNMAEYNTALKKQLQK